MAPRNDDWILEADELADSGGMPPPQGAPPGYIHDRAPPAGAPPPYGQARQDMPPSYAQAWPPWRLPGNHALHIGSVGRREGRVQPIAPRSPLDFDLRHGVFDRLRFELMPIPSHAMGVAYVNYPDRRWMLARRAGYTHVELRHVTAPFTPYRVRMGQFINEALQRVGARGWNTSRWFYFRWDVTQEGTGHRFL